MVSDDGKEGRGELGVEGERGIERHNYFADIFHQKRGGLYSFCTSKKEDKKHFYHDDYLRKQMNEKTLFSLISDYCNNNL